MSQIIEKHISIDHVPTLVMNIFLDRNIGRSNMGVAVIQEFSIVFHCVYFWTERMVNWCDDSDCLMVKRGSTDYCRRHIVRDVYY